MKKTSTAFAAIGIFAIAFFITGFASLRTDAQAQPVFTQNGHQTNSLVCNVPFTFDVPGLSQIWLVQLKSSQSLGLNQQTWNGQYTVPNTYTPNCTTDLGTYQNSAYAIVNGQQGSFLGTVEGTIISNTSPPSGEVTISDPALRTCFDHLAAVGGVLRSTDVTLSPGEWLVHVMNTQPAFGNNPITSANVSRSTLNQIVTALNTTGFGGPKYYFDSNTCIGFRSDGVAYGLQGYTTSWTGGSLNANGCPAWWTGNDVCSSSAPPIITNPPVNPGSSANNSLNPLLTSVTFNSVQAQACFDHLGAIYGLQGSAASYFLGGTPGQSLLQILNTELLLSGKSQFATVSTSTMPEIVGILNADQSAQGAGIKYAYDCKRDVGYRSDGPAWTPDRGYVDDFHQFYSVNSDGSPNWQKPRLSQSVMQIDLSAQYGIYHGAIYNLKTGQGFDNAAQFFNDAGLTDQTFQGLQFNTTYVPSFYKYPDNPTVYNALTNQPLDYPTYINQGGWSNFKNVKTLLK